MEQMGFEGIVELGRQIEKEESSAQGIIDHG
jgi:hypothetical protein